MFIEATPRPAVPVRGLVDPEEVHIQETCDGEPRVYYTGTDTVPLAVCGTWVQATPATATGEDVAATCGECRWGVGLLSLSAVIGAMS